MGTNYYWYEKEPCECCGREFGDGLHIGKSSAGWYFSLHIYPEDNINSLVDWAARFLQKGSHIVNEYNETITADKMIDIITERSCLPLKKRSAEWYRENHAHAGFNGLVAHDVDGRHCVGNGDGTWDYIVGDFS